MKLENSNSRLLVICPHFDDACFSVGGLLKKGHFAGVTVLTVFSRSMLAPNYRIFYHLYRMSNFLPDSFLSIFTSIVSIIRRKEDYLFCRAVKASQAVLPFDDSSLRGCNSFNPVFNRTEVEEDNPTSQTILREIEKTCLLGHFDFILCPLAIGNQVDHLIVMNTMLRILETNPYLRKKVLFYEDLPYAGYYNSDSINKIVTTRICSKSAQYIDITGEMSVKLKLMDIYWSQGHKKTPILEHAKNLYGTQNNTNLNDYYERIWSFGCP